MALTKKIATVAGLFCLSLATPALADDHVEMTTGKAVGEKMAIALNAGVKATLVWDDNESTKEEVSFTGKILELPVKGKVLKIETPQSITILYCGNNALTQLNVSGAKALEALVCNDNELTSLSLSQNASLTELNCQRNEIKTLSLDAPKGLEHLNVAQNPLASLNISRLKSLKSLNAAQTAVKQLNVKSQADLKTLWCQEGQLESVSFASKSQLESLYAYKNKLDELPLNNTVRLKYLWAADNQLTELDIKPTEELEELVVDRNKLHLIDATTATRSSMKEISLTENNLMFNSFPTLSSKLTAVLTPQNDYVMEQRVGTEEVLDLKDLLLYNMWRGSLNAEVVWKKADGTALVKDVDYKEPRKLNFQFLKPLGAVIGEVTSNKYPDVVLKIAGITVVEGTGIHDMQSEGLQIRSVNGAVEVTASEQTSVKIVSVGGQLFVQETVAPGTHSWKVPAGIYIVNGKKLQVGK